MAANLTGSTKLSKALALHPDVLAYIISLNPDKFSRLNNPLMRQIMPPRITLARIAAMTDVSLDELIDQIYALVGQSLTAIERAALSRETNLPQNLSQPPDWLEKPIAAVVDLLEGDDKLDTDPFVPLFPIINRAAVGDIILLKHRWEPAPLYDVWVKLKIRYYAVQQSPEEWWIYLLKTQAGKRGNR